MLSLRLELVAIEQFDTAGLGGSHDRDGWEFRRGELGLFHLAV
jgi:hypothetical protein